MRNKCISKIDRVYRIGGYSIVWDALILFDRIQNGENNIMEKEKIQIIHLQMVKDREVPYGSAHLDSPEAAVQFIKNIIADMICNRDRECMVVCATDTKLKPVCIQIVGIGTVNSCLYSIPEIFKVALLSNAANILLFHNHPSGNPDPSREDITCTRKVADAGKLLGITLQDHIILGDNGNYYSFQEAGIYL